MQDADFPILNLGFDDSKFNKLMGGMDYVKENNFYVDVELQKPANADYEKVDDEIYRLWEGKKSKRLSSKISG
ncbi:MAG TPA: hypothetical protein VFW58_05375 [Trichococcus sp.]|nr:hypothetical protein [Trichococcus sp.]